MWIGGKNNSNDKTKIGSYVVGRKSIVNKTCTKYNNSRPQVEQTKTIQCSPFEAHFGRLPKTEVKILRDSFIKNSDRLDKEHLERSALTAT